MSRSREPADAGYSEAKRLTEQYQKQMADFLREDLQGLAREGHFDDLLRDRVQALIHMGAFDATLRARAAAVAKQRAASSTGIGEYVRLGLFLVVPALIVVAVVWLWPFGGDGALLPGPESPTPVATIPPPSRSVPEGPPSPEIVRERVEEALLEGPAAFPGFAEELSARATEALGGILAGWEQGEPSDLDRIRRAMAQLIILQREPEVHTFGVDGSYLAPCRGQSCPAIQHSWQLESDAGEPGVPPFPTDQTTWESREVAWSALAEYERFLIARRMGWFQ